MKRFSLLAALLCAASSSFGAGKKPNIVFINADDLTHTDLSVYGGQAITPNFERLALEGMRFTHCFQAAPMCSPTRHNLYTGVHPVKSGAYPNHTFAKEGTKSIVHHLKPHGYRVALSGKTHIAPKSVFPFEYSGNKNPDMEVIEKLMIESKGAGTPFCLFACSNEPHTPWTYGDSSQYPPEKIKLPPWLLDTPETREGMSKYLAEITYYDSQVGQILDLLDKHGLAENTIVMLSTEQGNSLPFAKWTCYDNGLQTALIVRWPGKVENGSSTDAIVEYVDVVPTLLDAAGAEATGPLDGKSFLPVLKGETDQHKDFTFGIMTTRGIINGSDTYGIRRVRSKTHNLSLNLTPKTKFTNACTKSEEFLSWKEKAEAGDERAKLLLEKYHHRPRIELYELGKAWHEWNNLADSPEHVEIKKELLKQLDAWMKECGDLGQGTELAAYGHQGGKSKKNKGKAKRKAKK
jgi:uncharacterized sulfatase